MPRTGARLLSTLCVTTETLVPTSWLTSVDFPAFGASIKATKPERVSPASFSPSAGVVRLFIVYPSRRYFLAERRHPPVQDVPDTTKWFVKAASASDQYNRSRFKNCQFLHQAGLSRFQTPSR